MKNQPPFFSVVIPTLNEEKFLPRLLTDLVAQKEQDFEVLVVDANSQDKTQTVARTWSTKLPLTVIESSRGNVSFQRNLGAHSAQGTYLVFFDADVQIPRLYLHEIKKQLKRLPAPFVTTRVRPDSKDVLDKTIVRLVNLTMDVGPIVDRPFVGGYNFIVAREVFNLIGGFHENIFHAEDYDLAVRLHKAGYHLLILKKPLLIFSLRRFRHEGRLAVLRKNAQATLHILTRGSITQEIFSYPMGGGEYFKLKNKSQIKPDVLNKVQMKMKRFLRLFLE